MTLATNFLPTNVQLQVSILRLDHDLCIVGELGEHVAKGKGGQHRGLRDSTQDLPASVI